MDGLANQLGDGVRRIAKSRADSGSAGRRAITARHHGARQPELVGEPDHIFEALLDAALLVLAVVVGGHCAARGLDGPEPLSVMLDEQLLVEQASEQPDGLASECGFDLVGGTLDQYDALPATVCRSGSRANAQNRSYESIARTPSCGRCFNQSSIRACGSAR